MANFTQIPSNRVPLEDPRSPGFVSRDWYRWFTNLNQIIGGGGSVFTLTDLQQAPIAGFSWGGMAQQDADNVYTTGGTILPAVLFGSAPAGDAFVSNGSTIVPVPSTGSDAYLRMSAANVGTWQTPAYAQIMGTVDQALGTGGVAQAVAFENVIYSVGIAWNPGTPTRLTFSQAAVYSVTAQINLAATGVTLYNVYAWLRVNGVDIDNSVATMTVKGDTTTGKLTLAIFYTFRVGDYVEIYWTADNVAVSLNAVAAAGAVPAIPAAVLSVAQVSA